MVSDLTRHFKHSLGILLNDLSLQDSTLLSGESTKSLDQFSIKELTKIQAELTKEEKRRLESFLYGRLFVLNLRKQGGSFYFSLFNKIDFSDPKIYPALKHGLMFEVSELIFIFKTMFIDQRIKFDEHAKSFCEFVISEYQEEIREKQTFSPLLLTYYSKTAQFNKAAEQLIKLSKQEKIRLDLVSISSEAMINLLTIVSDPNRTQKNEDRESVFSYQDVVGLTHKIFTKKSDKKKLFNAAKESVHLSQALVVARSNFENIFSGDEWSVVVNKGKEAEEIPPVVEASGDAESLLPRTPGPGGVEKRTAVIYEAVTTEDKEEKEATLVVTAFSIAIAREIDGKTNDIPRAPGVPRRELPSFNTNELKRVIDRLTPENLYREYAKYLLASKLVSETKPSERLSFKAVPLFSGDDAIHLELIEVDKIPQKLWINWKLAAERWPVTTPDHNVSLSDSIILGVMELIAVRFNEAMRKDPIDQQHSIDELSSADLEMVICYLDRNKNPSDFLLNLVSLAKYVIAYKESRPDSEGILTLAQQELISAVSQIGESRMPPSMQVDYGRLMERWTRENYESFPFVPVLVRLTGILSEIQSKDQFFPQEGEGYLPMVLEASLVSSNLDVNRKQLTSTLISISNQLNYALFVYYFTLYGKKTLERKPIDFLNCVDFADVGIDTLLTSEPYISMLNRNDLSLVVDTKYEKESFFAPLLTLAIMHHDLLAHAGELSSEKQLILFQFLFDNKEEFSDQIKRHRLVLIKSVMQLLGTVEKDHYDMLLGFAIEHCDLMKSLSQLADSKLTMLFDCLKESKKYSSIVNDLRKKKLQKEIRPRSLRNELIRRKLVWDNLEEGLKQSIIESDFIFKRRFESSSDATLKSRCDEIYSAESARLKQAIEKVAAELSAINIARSEMQETIATENQKISSKVEALEVVSKINSAFYHSADGYVKSFNDKLLKVSDYVGEPEAVDSYTNKASSLVKQVIQFSPIQFDAETGGKTLEELKTIANSLEKKHKNAVDASDKVEARFNRAKDAREKCATNPGEAVTKQQAYCSTYIDNKGGSLVCPQIAKIFSEKQKGFNSLKDSKIESARNSARQCVEVGDDATIASLVEKFNDLQTELTEIERQKSQYEKPLKEAWEKRRTFVNGLFPEQQPKPAGASAKPKKPKEKIAAHLKSRFTAKEKVSPIVRLFRPAFLIFSKTLFCSYVETLFNDQMQAYKDATLEINDPSLSGKNFNPEKLKEEIESRKAELEKVTLSVRKKLPRPLGRKFKKVYQLDENDITQSKTKQKPKTALPFAQERKDELNQLGASVIALNSLITVNEKYAALKNLTKVSEVIKALGETRELIERIDRNLESLNANHAAFIGSLYEITGTQKPLAAHPVVSTVQPVRPG